DPHRRGAHRRRGAEPGARRRGRERAGHLGARAGVSRGGRVDAGSSAEVALTRPLVALIGNPNTGKTTLFNGLTGSRARVGNYPGVTVERRSATMRLPGGDAPARDGARAMREEELV